MSTPVFDYTTNFYLGQDAYNEPDRIAPEAYAKGINVKTQKSVLSPRWGWALQDLEFQNIFFRNNAGIKRTLKNLFETGRFQALIPCYVPESYYVLMVIGGFIFRKNILTNQVTLLSDTIKPNANTPRLNWTVADKYIVIFDYPNYPIIIDDTNVFRSDPNFTVAGFPQPQIPVSVLGTYNQSRLEIANAGNDWTAGDPVGNLATPYAPITFTETLVPAQAFFNQFFTLNTNSNREPITAMGFIQALDESTGVGPLFIASKNSLYYARTDIPRVDWESVKFSALYAFNTGIVGQRAFVNLNSDLMFLAADGTLRSITTSRNDAQRWSNTSISREVENFLKYDDIDLAPFSVLGYFKNRLFVTANPYRVEALDFEGQPIFDIANGGFVTMTLDNVATFRQQAPPIWDGLWTGIRPMDICTVNNRCFVMSKDDTQINRLYEVRPDLTYDITNRGEESIESVVYTREYDFKNSFADKYSYSMTLPFKDVQGEFDLRVEYRPSNYANFRLYQEFHHEAPTNSCKQLLSLNELAPHGFRDLTLSPQFVNSQCDPVSDSQLSFFREMQFKLTMRGKNWMLPQIQIKGTAIESPDRINSCGGYKSVEVITECLGDWINKLKGKLCS